MLTELIGKLANENDFDLWGICSLEPSEHSQYFVDWLGASMAGEMEYLNRSISLRHDPTSLLPGSKTAIVFGRNYLQPTHNAPEGVLIAQYALGKDYHKVMRKKLVKIASQLAIHHPEASFRACVDSAPIFERELAQRAGLGWIGKNTCLINSQRGSWFLIGVLLTTLDLPRSTPSTGGCGSCQKCIESCPTGAIVFFEGRWAIDSRSCISYLTIEHRGDIAPELQTKMGNWVVGCDICQIVCPFNEPRQNQPLRAKPAKQSPELEPVPWPPLAEASNMPFEEWDQLTRGRATRRPGYEATMRNIKIALKNESNLPSDSDKV